MSRADGMQEVELTDPSASGTDQDPRADREGTELSLARRRRRRAVLRWWPLALLAVAGVVAGQVVLDVRERARVAAAREQPGVVGYDVGPTVVLDPVGPDAPPADGVVAGELVVVPGEVVPGRARTVAGSASASGDTVWRIEVETAEHAAAHGSIEPPWCSAGDAPVTRVTCLVQDRLPADPVTGETGALVRSRLLVLDVRTGEVVRERELAPASTAFVSGDALVRAEVAGGTVRVALDDAVTGDPRWATDLPAVAGAPAPSTDPAGLPPAVRVTDAHVTVWFAEQAWSVRRDDGGIEVAGSGVWVGRGDRLITTGTDDAVTRLHGVDGSGDVLTLGSPAYLDVDDGSVPGLDLLTDTLEGVLRIRAVDPATGRQVWERELGAVDGGTFILLDDVLYGADADDVWALDARDGTDRWRTPRDPEADQDASGRGWFSPTTDGRVLMLPEIESVDAPAVLHAWSLTSGALVWTAPLPAEAGYSLHVEDGRLFGIGQDRSGSGDPRRAVLG